MKNRFHGKRIIWERDEAELAELTKAIAAENAKGSDSTSNHELAELLGFKGCFAICIWKGDYFHGTYCDYFIRVFGPRNGERRRFGVVQP